VLLLQVLAALRAVLSLPVFLPQAHKKQAGL
jgi:hypothetical protein